MGDKPYFSVPFALSYEDLQEAAGAFLDFLKLPRATKESLWIRCGLENEGDEFGYRRREYLEGGDNKEFFHYHPQFDVEMKDREAYALPETQRFLDHARKVDVAAAETLHATLSEFSNEFPNLIDEYFPPSGRKTFVRFLKYDIAGQGNFLAKGHYDKGGCSLAIAESAPGLRLGRTDKDLALAPHADRTVLFMPALRLRTVTDSRFHPVWHDVVQVSNDTLSQDAARWAIVFFADGVSQIRPNPSEVYTPREFI